mgnify:CR=1 FL=1
MPDGILLLPITLIVCLAFNYFTKEKENIKGTALRCSRGILRTNLRIMLFLVVSIIGVTFVFGILETVGARYASKDLPSVVGSLGPFLALLTVIMISEYFFIAIDKKGTLGLSFSKTRAREGLEGVMYGALILIACLLPAIITKSIDPFAMMAERLDPSVLSNWLGMLVIAALFEEVVFRGYVFRTMTYTCPLWVPLSLTSLLFSWVHWEQAAAIQEGSLLLSIFKINVFLAGWLMAKLVLRTGNLWYAWWWHFSWNFTQGPIFGISVSGTEIGTNFGAIYSDSGINWITGGGIGIEASIPATAILYIAILKEKEILNFFRKKEATTV